MIRLLGKWYSRRIVNVNVNVIVAGLLALMPLAATIHIATTYFGLTDKLWIAVLTFVADVSFDVVIYYALHWLANHAPHLTRRLPDPGTVVQPSFFKDASLVQFERAALSPLLYALALGLQNFLMHRGFPPTIATVLGFILGMCVVRFIHTFWMVRQARTKTAAALAAPPKPVLHDQRTGTHG